MGWRKLCGPSTLNAICRGLTVVFLVRATIKSFGSAGDSPAMFDLFRSRDKAVRIVLSVLLGLVGLSMVTYLIPGTGLDPTAAPDSTVLATIGKEQITSQEVAKVVQN